MDGSLSVTCSFQKSSTNRRERSSKALPFAWLLFVSDQCAKRIRWIYVAVVGCLCWTRRLEEEEVGGGGKINRESDQKENILSCQNGSVCARVCVCVCVCIQLYWGLPISLQKWGINYKYKMSDQKKEEKNWYLVNETKCHGRWMEGEYCSRKAFSLKWCSFCTPISESVNPSHVYW